MKRSDGILQKIKEIERLLEEVKLKVKEVFADGVVVKEEDKSNEVQAGQESQPGQSLKGFKVGDKVKFGPTATTRGGRGIIVSWTDAEEPFLRIAREGSPKGRPILRKPHKVQLIS